jgi:hypothetical protein
VNILRFLILLVGCITSVQAAVLPEERGDILYHSYDGGGVTVVGPSVLVRKNFGDSVSLGYNHYVDNVSSASIDVITTASPYTEQRKENTILFDYLREKTTMSFGYTRSVESDFDATTGFVNISQDMFGDLTTVNMGFAVGDNIIRQNGNDSFEEESKVRNYRLSLSQVFSKSLIVAFALETITDEGFLNNPYRSVRYEDATSAQGFSFQPEVYPQTRTSNAFAVRGKYYLQRRAAIFAGYRVFGDSWGIDASTIELGYTLPYEEAWIFETRLRLYEQSGADFYSDLFPFRDAQNHLARDKELSAFDSISVGVGASYEFDNRDWSVIKRASLNLYMDFFYFDYADFRDITQGGAVGSEPLYSFDATVIRAFASVWF